VQEAIEQVDALRSETERHPADIKAWLRLGDALLRLEHYESATRAFERANRVGEGRDAGALAGLAEAQLLAATASAGADGAPSEQAMTRATRASQLFEQALKIDPANGKALFYSGMIALQQGELPRARERFVAMRAGGVPAEIGAALDKQIAAIDEQLKPAVVDAATAIRLDVSVSDALRAQVPVQAPLYVFVRGAAGGAPLAVKRLTTTLPTRIVLSGADSMIAGNGLAAGQQVSVVARVSLSGAPTAQSGDLFGELQTRAGAAGTQKLVIDQRTP
jgi:cytochrome c-type biogenesis protein CcmH